MFSDYRGTYDQIARDDLEVGIQDDDYLEVQADRLFGYLGEVRGKDVCELGMGKGLLLDRLLSSGPRSITAVDIAVPLLERYSDDPLVRLVMANAENLPFAEEFDLLVASDILEHVFNVGDVLLSSRRSLRSGGRLVVKVPLEEDLIQYARAEGCPYRFVHLRSFSAKGLTRLLEQAGFVVERLRFDGFQRYRVRPWIVRRRRLYRRVRAFLDARYPTERDLHAIPAWLGRLLMVPAEVTAVARPRQDRSKGPVC